jgi:hypothetical protein
MVSDSGSETGAGTCVQVGSDAVTVARPPLLTSISIRHQVTRCSMPYVVVLAVVCSHQRRPA